jgi:chromosome segregation ATPase
MKWAADEESRSKTKEIENLRKDFQSLHVQREDALESQRRDLTSAFENIINQRELTFHAKEQEIAQQISMLDRRFEQLQTENLRLKNELTASQHDVERLSAEVSSLEENKRLLQWQVEDLHNKNIFADDALQRKLQQVSTELSAAKEIAHREKFELEKKLEKVCDLLPNTSVKLGIE